MVQDKATELHILGIDLSRASDTVHRHALLHVVSEVTYNIDVVRMVQILLTQTTLQVCIEKVKASAFETNIGDSLSPILFNCYYETAMRDLRPKFPALPQNDGFRSLPSETHYADLDFLSFDPQHLESALEVCSDNLPKWNLQVNRDKTERT